MNWAHPKGDGGLEGRESARILEERHGTSARDLGVGPGFGVFDRSGRLSVRELGSVAVGVLFVDPQGHYDPPARERGLPPTAGQAQAVGVGARVV